MARPHPKRQFLAEAGALHAHPERVRAAVFEQYRFFDPLDKVQVKYEMLRAHALEGSRVTSVAEEFGFSRETYYASLAAFEAWGIPGLADGKPGRPGPLKLTDEAAAWVTPSGSPKLIRARVVHRWGYNSARGLSARGAIAIARRLLVKTSCNRRWKKSTRQA